MFRIGLTGGMGSGKSEVARSLAELGAHVIEADAVARDLVAPGTDTLRAIAAEFGESVLNADGSLDRRALAAAAFGSAEATSRLNAITERPLIDEIVRRAEELSRRHPGGVLVVDAALLVQWDILDLFDHVLVVRAAADVRVGRLVAAGFGEDDVRKRIASQLPEETMLEAADTVIENEGTIEELRARVAAFWESLPAGTTEDER
jgi:dephospho-CoA kinase